jgi:ribose transport system permease protein
MATMNRLRLQRLTLRHSYLFALLLLVIVAGVNFYLQPNLFQPRVLAGNLRVFFPLILLTIGQTIVIIGGGIDLSVGAMVSMSNAIMVTLITPESTPVEIILGIALTIGAAVLAGAFNGWAVAYLRLQPIVTTYATSFIYGGIALLVLPRPGGQFPRDFLRGYRETPLGIPLPLYFIVAAVIFWLLLRGTRYGQFLYATGGKDDSAYATGVPVNRLRLTTYVWAGFFAALSALALTMSVGTGNPRIGDAMTLDSIVAVVLGGTSLSGGQGGVVGSVFGVLIVGLIRNIISFANVPTWSQTLVDALIIIFALAGPGLVRFVQAQIKQRRLS